jgi:hypothetical protein
MSVLHGIIERKGGWYYYGDRKWQGTDSVIASIREEVDLMEDLRKKVIDLGR